MKHRKHNWCVFADGHKEKIDDFHMNNKDEIYFCTKSGEYRFIRTPEEELPTIKPLGLISMSDCMKYTRFEKWVIRPALSIYGITTTTSGWEPYFNIDRIEIVEI